MIRGASLALGRCRRGLRTDQDVPIGEPESASSGIIWAGSRDARSEVLAVHPPAATGPFDLLAGDRHDLPGPPPTSEAVRSQIHVAGTGVLASVSQAIDEIARSARASDRAGKA